MGWQHWARLVIVLRIVAGAGGQAGGAVMRVTRTQGAVTMVTPGQTIVTRHLSRVHRQGETVIAVHGA